MILKFHAETPVVKGFNRSCIYDLIRKKHDFFPNEALAKIFSLENHDLNKIKNILDDDEKSWLSYFVEKEYCFYIPKEFIDCFPKIDFNWKCPSKITNAIIDIEDLSTNFDFQVLEDLNCKHIVIRFKNGVNINGIFLFLQRKMSELTFKSVDLLIEKEPNVKIKEYSLFKKKILSEVRQISNVTVSKKSELKKTRFFRPNFIVEIDTFAEAQINNLYFNKKLYIDSSGDVKNGVESEKTFSNISNELNVEKIIDSPKFQKLWKINKDKIDVCKDCEFRYMCVDNRIPIQRDKNEFYFETECSYNPYISKWYGEKNYTSLKNTGIISNKAGFFIDEEKVEKINKVLWEE